MEKILILGGSFNPIHNGHIKTAVCAAKELKADRIIFVPTGRSGYKETDSFASREHRLNMCRLAAAGEDIEISTVELDREEQSYTYSTAAILKEENPGSKLYFLCGSDMFLTLHTWKNPRRIFESASVAVALRGRDEQEDIEAYKQKYFPECDIVFVRTGKIDISSSRIRAELARGEKPRGLPQTVYDYIIKNGLYRKEK